MTHLAAITLCLAVAVTSAAAGDNPRARLDWLAGDWTIEGREQSFRETCAWFHERSHLVCNSESQGKSGLRKGVSVISYSDAGGRFVYYHYGSSGVVVAMDVFIGDRALIATAERRTGGDLVREQVWMTPNADGSYEFREETSTNGGPWTVSARFRYIRRGTAEAEGEGRR